MNTHIILLSFCNLNKDRHQLVELVQSNDLQESFFLSRTIYCNYLSKHESIISPPFFTGPKHKLYEILEFVQKKRSIVQPNMAFMGQLVQWEDQLKGNIKPSKQLSDKENNAIKDIVQLTQQIKS